MREVRMIELNQGQIKTLGFISNIAVLAVCAAIQSPHIVEIFLIHTGAWAGTTISKGMVDLKRDQTVKKDGD